MENLSEKERSLLAYIKERLIDQVPPTVREICRDLGIKSTSSAHRYLKSLEAKGYITTGDNENRVIRLVGAEYGRTAQIPLLGTVTAGQPILAFEEVTDYIPFSATGDEAKKLFALKVRGDSMIEAAILDGDVVVVKQVPSVENGAIAVVMVEDEATVKRFYKENGHYRLQPENSSMDPIIVDDCRILGRVVAVIRQLD
ncbi:MAG: transcriptional repressor LexA [Oscillospiraceae bacterium]|nr:transcriptional repressor LexA [Oscillospiraceae bacterium]MBP1556356.1 transcriptional repressor LexA [Oscillospiraceae bacterium]